MGVGLPPRRLPLISDRLAFDLAFYRSIIQRH
jgi:hypothetical protein